MSYGTCSLRVLAFSPWCIVIFNGSVHASTMWLRNSSFPLQTGVLFVFGLLLFDAYG